MYLNSSRRAFSGRLILGLSALSLLRAESSDDPDQKDDKRSKQEDKVYDPGGDVKAPKLVHYVEPQFSSSSKGAFVEGTVRISTVVTPDGVPTSMRVTNGVSAEEDRTAMEALKQWRFRPGTKNGQPVNVRVTVEVDFHLL